MTDVYDYSPGRWAVSTGDDWEGLVGGTYATREEAIAAAPEMIVRQCGEEAKAETFLVGELIPWPIRIPAGLPKVIAEQIYQETFTNYENPPSLEVAEDRFSQLSDLLVVWAKHANVTGGETFVGSFEEIDWPAAN